MPAARRQARPLTPEERAVIIRRYRAGGIITKLAAEYDLPTPSVHALLIEEKVPLRAMDAAATNLTAEERTAEIIRLRRDYYMTYQEIGDRFMITRERVRQILKAHGLDSRHPLPRSRG